MKASTRPFPRLLAAELMKLRRSSALRAAWLLPALFLGLEFLVFERPVLIKGELSPGFASTFDTIQLKMIGSLWAGFFHPLLVALLPALLFRSEHRFKTWGHLHAMPVPKVDHFLAKGVVLLLLSAASLTLVGAGLWGERSLLGTLHPALRFPFHAKEMVRTLSWLLLGSLPLLALYLWVSDRINSVAVPVVFGLLGMILTIALSGQELEKPWKRDLIPWVLPYFCAQHAMRGAGLGQEVHAAAMPFQEEPNTLRLPSGKRVRTWQAVPDDVLFPPPPPTPGWVLGWFSLGLGTALLGLGLLDARRSRV